MCKTSALYLFFAFASLEVRFLLLAGANAKLGYLEQDDSSAGAEEDTLLHKFTSVIQVEVGQHELASRDGPHLRLLVIGGHGAYRGSRYIWMIK